MGMTQGEYITEALQSIADSGLYHAPTVKETTDPAPFATYRPVVLMHGLGDAGSNPGMQSLAKSVMAKYPGIYAVAVNVANGFDSFVTPMQKQTDQFNAVVTGDPKLAGGFNVVGLSQGGLVVRAYIEQYNNPPVHNFVSICGVQNGEFDCPLEIRIIPFLCDMFKANPYRFLFNGSIPLSFSDYWKDSMNQTKYLTENRWLPFVNNERPSKNAQYKKNLESLNQLVLVEATKDTVVYPYQSEQFGGYKWGTTDTIFTMKQGAIYNNDYIGLKELDAAGKILFNSYPGQHVQFSQQFWDSYVLPFFDN